MAKTKKKNKRGRRREEKLKGGIGGRKGREVRRVGFSIKGRKQRRRQVIERNSQQIRAMIEQILRIRKRNHGSRREIELKSGMNI